MDLKFGDKKKDQWKTILVLINEIFSIMGKKWAVSITLTWILN